MLEDLNDRILAAYAYRDTADVFLKKLGDADNAAYGYRIALTYARLERLTEVDSIQTALEQCQGGPRPVKDRVAKAAELDPIVMSVLSHVSDWEHFSSVLQLREELRNLADAKKPHDPQMAISIWRTVAALSWEADDQNWLAGALNEAATLSLGVGDTDSAQWYYEQGSNAARQVHDWRQLMMCQYNLGTLFGDRGDKKAAANCLDEAVQSARRMGDDNGLARVLKAVQDFA